MEDILRRTQIIASKHEKLLQSRAELLTKREVIRTRVREVQEQRDAAGNAEVAFMTYVRAIATNGVQDTSSHEQNTTLGELYNQVESARNTVGVLETNLIDYGRMLTGAEVRFEEEETEFYEYELPELFEDAISTLERITTTHALPIISHIPPPPLPPPPFCPPPQPLRPNSLDSLQQDPRSSHSSGRDHCSVPSPLLPPPTPPPSFLSSHMQHIQQQESNVSSSLRRRVPLRSPGKHTEKLVVDKQKEQQQQHDSVELCGMGEQFDPIEESQIHTRDLEDVGSEPSILLSFPGSTDSHTSAALVTSPLDPLASAGHSGPDSKQTFIERVSMEMVASTRGRRCSEPFKHKEKLLVAPQLFQRPWSESAFVDISARLAPRLRVRAWLLALLEESTIERTRYKNILEDTLEKYGFDWPSSESWEESAKEFWGQDSGSNFEQSVPESEYASLGSDISPDPCDVAQSFNGALQRRRSTRTNPAIKILDSRGLRNSPGPFSNSELDEPSFFPLPRTPGATFSQLDSEDSSMDEPYYFPLPSSPVSEATEIEGFDGPGQE